MHDMYETFVLRALDMLVVSKETKHQLRSSLVRYYAAGVRDAPTESAKRQIFAKASAQVNVFNRQGEATTMMHFVTRSVLLSVAPTSASAEKRENLRQARAMLDQVLSVVETYVPAKLESAALYFEAREYKKALIEYSESLLLEPSLGANVRVQMALCFVKLGKEAKARAAFERALALEENHLGALIGLGLALLNDGNAPEGMKYMARAYKVDKTNPIVLNTLADHYFHRGAIKKSRALAQQVLEASHSPLLNAEALYLIGRVCHAQDDLDQAYEYYKGAIELRPNYPLALYGAAQVNISRNKLSRALSALRSVLKYQPGNFEALSAIGHIYTIQRKRPEALAALKEALNVVPDDVDTLIEYASLIDAHKPQEALEKYTMAMTSMVQAEKPIPAALHNNIGVLSGVLGDYDGAHASFDAALAVLGVPDAPLAPINRTVTFNRARVLEDARHFEEARNLYRDLLGAYPSFVDCHLRLGCIARTLGDYSSASNHVKDAFAINDNDISAWSLSGMLHVERKEFQPAQRAFEHILGTVSSKDAYSLIALGNIFYASVRPSESKTLKWLDKARSFFKRVLRLDPSNVYAANGIGLVLGDMGELGAAKLVFDSVREASPQMADVYVNLGHCALYHKHYAKAIKNYEMAQSFSHPSDVMILLFIGRAHFDNGDYVAARRILAKAMHVEPSNVTVRFDFALALQHDATRILQMPKDQRRVHHVERAIRLLTMARKEYNYLFVNRLASRAKDYLKYCDEALSNAEMTLEAAKIMQETMEAARAAREAQEAEQAAAEAAAAAAAAAAKAAEEAEREAQVAAQKARLASITENWDVRQASRKRRKRKKSGPSDSQDLPESDDLPPPIVEGEWVDDQGEEDAYVPGQDEEGDQVVGMDVEGQEEEEEGGAAPVEGPPRKRHKKIIESDSDSDDDQPAPPAEPAAPVEPAVPAEPEQVAEPAEPAEPQDDQQQGGDE